MSTSGNLTRRQQQVFEFIRDKILENHTPTVREIGDAFNISSPNGVMCHLKALEKKGYIVRHERLSRAIELAPHILDDINGLPFRGEVAAGLTNLAFEQNERVNFGEMFSRDDFFTLKVRGDSMIEAQIADGDYVIVKQQSVASAGDMVVAQNEDGEATLKYWYPENGRVRLQPANSAMEPIYLDQATVMGVVVGVVRNLS